MSTPEETLMKEIYKKMFEDMTRVLADYGLEEFELTQIQLERSDQTDAPGCYIIKKIIRNGRKIYKLIPCP